jgi:hypothetical protein
VPDLWPEHRLMTPVPLFKIQFTAEGAWKKTSVCWIKKFTGFSNNKLDLNMMLKIF